MTDDTQRYLELVIEDAVNVIKTSGGDEPSANEIARIEGTLTEADYPTVTKIGYFAFAGLQLTKINFPKVTDLKECAFFLSSLPATFTFPKVTTIEAEVFVENNTITEITQENFPMLTVLQAECFKDMLALEKVDFSKITKIEEKAFKGCTSLQTLILRKEDTTVDLYDDQWFVDTPIGQGTGSIYVPDALVDTYKASVGWMDYEAQIKPLSEYAG